MERNEYNDHLAFIEYLKNGILDEIADLDASELENRLKKFERALLQLDDLKDKCVEIMLKNDADRNDALQWVNNQKTVIKSFCELKTTLQTTLKGLRVTEQRHLVTEQQAKEEEISDFKEKLDIERAKRVAENEQKINALVQDNLANMTEERQKREQAYYEKISTIRKEGNVGGFEGSTPQVKLQKLHMSPFTGDIIDFARFWPQFITEIDQSNINDISKFNYLIELLKGKPKNDVLGLPHNADGYEEAKRILQAGYGKDTVVFKQLVIQLQEMPVIRSIYQKQEINEFSNKFSRIVRTLKTMKKLDSTEAFVHTIFIKLGPLRENLAANSENWENWKMEDLAEKLKQYVDRNNLNIDKGSNEYKPFSHRNSERHAQSERNRPEQNSQYNNRRSEGNSRYKDKTFYNGENKSRDDKQRCIFCNYTNHEAKDCLKVLDLAKRRDIIKTKNLCYVCLKGGHMAMKCRASLCSKCNRRHNIVICDEEKSTIPSKDETSDKAMTSIQQYGTMHSTAIVDINGVSARLMVDTGSTRSHISTDLIQRLNLKPFKREFCTMEQLYNGSIRKRVEIYKIRLRSLFSDFELEIQVNNTEKDIITHLPNYNIGKLKFKYKELTNLKFSDENSTENNLPVHIILGTKDYNRIKTTKAPIICHDGEMIVAECTKLGWILSGGVNIGDDYFAERGFLLTNEQQFERMTKLDLLGITEREETAGDFHDEFMKGLRQTKNGRYIANLPWKRDIVGLPNNKQLALCRLKKNTERLIKLNKIEEYHDIMKEQITEGILEEVSEPKSLEGVHYIPHQAVIKEEAQSTKLRVVYDCSAKARSEEPSLNDCLETGPPLQPHLFDILMRARTYKYLITGDICKAFHQIMVKNEDTDTQRLFWYNNLADKLIKEYRFTRVIFGCNASPYILGATLQKHFSKFEHEYPESVQSLLQNTYVDDILAGSDSVEKLKEFKDNAIHIMGKAQMKLHKWKSNSRALEKAELREDHSIEEYPTFADITNNTGDHETKILGITWDKVKDNLSISFKEVQTKGNKITKRIILSYVHGIFDILGIISPITIIGKVIFSKLCLKKLRWDENIPDDIAKEWETYIGKLASAKTVTFPRFILSDNPKCIEIHGFCDASLTAVCAAVYLVTRGKSGNKQFLLVSKNRVAPKETSVPRLELIGALMLSKLLTHVKTNLKDLTFSKCIAWTDSSTVLYWLNSKGTYSVYVRNRVSKINEANITWLYIPTGENPADIGSRGCYPEQLSGLWFHGPIWLTEEEKWPTQTNILETEDSKNEKSKCQQLIMAAVEQRTDEGALDSLLTKPYRKMLRITAYVFRFLYRKHDKDTLTPEEIQKAEQFWIKRAQNSIKPSDKQHYAKTADGIYIISGRIKGYSPIFIPRSHDLARSLVADAHTKNYPRGSSFNNLRNKKRILDSSAKNTREKYCV